MLVPSPEGKGPAPSSAAATTEASAVVPGDAVSPADSANRAQEDHEIADWSMLFAKLGWPRAEHAHVCDFIGPPVPEQRHYPGVRTADDANVRERSKCAPCRPLMDADAVSRRHRGSFLIERRYLTTCPTS